jgi:GTPase SAR1 family protein
VGNKADVNQVERVVSLQEGQQLAERYKLPFFETSAKENININEIFELLSRTVVARIESRTTPTLQEPARKLDDSLQPDKKRMCC